MEGDPIAGETTSPDHNTTTSEDHALTPFRIAEKRYKLYRYDRRTARRKQPPETDFSDVVDFRHLDANTEHNRSLIREITCPDVSQERCFAFAAVPGLLVFPEAISEAKQQELCRDAVLMYGNSRLHPNHLSTHVSNPRSTRRYEAPMRWAVLGFSYEWTSKSYSRDHYSPFPMKLRRCIEHILRLCDGNPGFKDSAVDGYEPQTAIVNYFTVGTMMMAHQDVSEESMEQPLISISLGCSCVFLMGSSSREDAPYAFWLRSGDVAVFSGPSRVAFHSVPRVLDDCPRYLCLVSEEGPVEQEEGGKTEEEEEHYWREQMRHLRININVRQAMLTKFDVRSCRVKGISFHKSRPWVLCGLHNGSVQIWDYRTNTSIDTYTEHSGSVRGVDFHISQPLFVSGADDYLIKVWNYKLRRCLFTLRGHMDYIRVTFFHHEQPWILSCSDDFTVRIWNWQSRSGVACFPGHNHYVMCAQFHPREDLVVSASLDRTIRVWDISSLRLCKQETGLAQDLLGTSDVALKFLLEGHEKGVNWVCFHPTKPYIVSAADDRTVRVWRMMESSCHEELQLRGHTNNVCCVTYMKDFLISNSEDRTIRVWDVKSRNPVMVFRRESDRYWILATLPEKNLIAAGHDSGMQVFKLFRERPAWVVNGNLLHYIYDNILYSYDFDSRAEYKFNLSPHLYPPNTISCNPVDNLAVVWYNTEGGASEAFTIPKPGYAVDSEIKKRQNVTDAVFFAPNKYAFVDKSKRLVVCNCQGERDKPVTPEQSCKRVFPGPMGSVVCQTDEGVKLYHMAQRAVTAEAVVPGVRHVVWDKEFNKVAFLARNAITVMTKRLKLITTIVGTTMRMKSAAFDEQRNILYYTTANHLNYCNLSTGECSTIQTLRCPVYLVRANGDTIWVITREGKVVMQELDNLELNFKLKLQQQAYRDVLKIIQRKQLKGQALVGYLHKHGHSEIALHFVTDPLTRFNLAVECGALNIAKATALELNQVLVWKRLTEAATLYGDIQLAQFSISKTGNYHGAGLLSLITGNMAALGHLVESSKDDSFKLHYGLYLHDVQQRVNILENAGHLPLAYLTAKSNGLDDVALALLSKMEPDVAERILGTKVNSVSEVARPSPVTENWPMLQVEESVFARLLKEPGQINGIQADLGEEEAEEEDIQTGAGWDEDEDEDEDDDTPGLNTDGGRVVEGEGWDDELDIQVPTEQVSQKGAYIVPTEYPPLSQQWVESCSLPSFHVVAGSFATAFDLLRRQIGLGDPAPLKPYVMNLWTSVNASRPAWFVPSVVFPLTRHSLEEHLPDHPAPQLPDYIPVLTERLRAGYAAFVEGRFADALEQFVGILHQAVFATYHDEKQRAALLELMTISAEYARALNVQLHSRSINGNSKEALELALYFTHFKLQRSHLTLALSQAMSKAYKKKNIKTAVAVARRLLEQDPPQAKAKQAAAIVAEGEKGLTDVEPVEYDERNPFSLCSVSHRPMYKGIIEPVRCSYCYSPAHPETKGKICPVCRIALLGVESAGLVNRI